MKLSKFLILLFISSFLCSCNNFKSSIHAKDDGYYIENTSGNQILKYTIKFKRTIDDTYTVGIKYITLYPGDFVRIGPQSVLIGDAEKIVYREKFSIAFYKMAAKIREVKSARSVDNPFKIIFTGKMIKNRLSLDDLKYHVSEQNRSLIKILDSALLTDSIWYRYLYQHSVVDKIIKLPQKTLYYTYKVVGAIEVKE